MKRLEVLHQLGHNHSWNFQSLQTDETGDGVIIGPRYFARQAVEGLEPRDREFAIFDPQFFLPGTPKGELGSYDFFPQLVADGFSTSDFAVADGEGRSAAQASADGCVQFQVRNEFRHIVVPTRFFEGTPTDFIAKQEELFVRPFLNALSDYPGHHPVLLQLLLNDLMIKDAQYTTELLNWVTGMPEIAGVYLILSVNRRGKQLKDMELLYPVLRFIAALEGNGMDVVVGYTNTEALLLSIAGPLVVTMGCYENMRMFNIRTFEDDEKKKPMGPKPRIYLSRLLQWVDADYIPFMDAVLHEGEAFYDENEYQARMFHPSFNWHFTKPELYKHAFAVFCGQLREAGQLTGRDRYERVTAMMRDARGWYDRFEQAGIEFDSDSDGSHLPAWLTVANKFATDQGWR